MTSNSHVRQLLADAQSWPASSLGISPWVFFRPIFLLCGHLKKKHKAGSFGYCEIARCLQIKHLICKDLFKSMKYYGH